MKTSCGNLYWIILLIVAQTVLFIIFIAFPSQSRIFRNMFTISRRNTEKKRLFTVNELSTFSTHVENTTLKNPVYKRLSIPRDSKDNMQQVEVLLVVTSGPGRVHRRNAIRKTWWKECKQQPKVWFIWILYDMVFMNASEEKLMILVVQAGVLGQLRAEWTPLLAN